MDEKLPELHYEGEPLDLSRFLQGGVGQAVLVRPHSASSLVYLETELGEPGLPPLPLPLALLSLFRSMRGIQRQPAYMHQLSGSIASALLRPQVHVAAAFMSGQNPKVRLHICA